ncbi:MAG: hypothetical protein IH945_12875 [Armatimonadetes bacterium]|nr:hypothetical protein [Armatimonadota bacterium]
MARFDGFSHNCAHQWDTMMNSTEEEIRQLEESPFHDAYIMAWNVTNAAGLIDFEDLDSLPQTLDVVALLPELDADAAVQFAKRRARLTHDFQDPRTEHVWRFEANCTAVGELIAAVVVRRPDLLEPVINQLLQDPVARSSLLFVLSSSYWQERWPIKLVLIVLDRFIEDGLDIFRPQNAFDTLIVRAREALEDVSRKEDRSQKVQEKVAHLLTFDCFRQSAR